MHEAYQRRRIKRRLLALRKQLESTESGRLSLRKRKVGATSWSDETPREIALLKASIADYEAILAKYEKR